ALTTARLIATPPPRVTVKACGGLSEPSGWLPKSNAAGLTVNATPVTLSVRLLVVKPGLPVELGANVTDSTSPVCGPTPNGTAWMVSVQTPPAGTSPLASAGQDGCAPKAVHSPPGFASEASGRPTGPLPALVAWNATSGPGARR